jgi:UDP-N-acetylglucosamine 2-epimerase (non-hydrolysing)
MAARLGPALLRLAPSLVVVLGDVDSTVAGALAARRCGIPLAHVEAGLRCRDPRMPEERNRVLVDALADRLHVPERSGLDHLAREGVPRRRIRLEGNVMADALAWARPRLDAGPRRRIRGLARGPYVVATLHRQANVDEAGRLEAWTRAFAAAAREIPVVLPLHPRTRRRLGTAAVRTLERRGVCVSPPLGYLDFLALVRRARAVVTDSGGLQVETSLLGVPCVTLRRRTEHVLTLTHGTNRLASDEPRRLGAALRAALEAPAGPRRRRLPRVWDGHAAERIVAGWLRGVPGGRRGGPAASGWDLTT